MSIIEVKNLCKSFNGVEVLKNVNLSVNEGEIISIIGGSGCGKSVFLRCIELLEIPDSGEIYIDGQEITSSNADVDIIRRSMGMVYQKFHLFQHLNVMENLTLAPTKLLQMPKSDAEEKAVEWLKKVGLIAKRYSYPTELSGGQQQRIAICRSLMMNPKIMLFDEPTSALDPTMVGEVLAVMRMLTKNQLTMIIVTHEMNFAREVANRVLFFAEHGIYEQGTPKEIFDNPQKPLTVAFINKLKFFHYEIEDKNFDLMQMQGGIWDFAERYGFDRKKSFNLQLCCEETIYEMMTGCYDDGDKVSIIIDIIYSESKNQTEIKISSSGKKYNLLEFEDDSLDHLGVTIINRIAHDVEYSYEDHLNKITIQI